MIRKSIFIIFSLANLFLISSCTDSCTRTVKGYDISPDMPNGTVLDNGTATAGVITELAGSDANLYAIGLNSGIWRSINGAPWRQISNSPRYTSTVAVSPVNPKHIAAGEHDGEIYDYPASNRTGLWESFDAGATWQLTWTDTTLTANLDDRNINALAFSPMGTLLFSAEGHVFRRTLLQNNSENCVRKPYCFEEIDLPTGVGTITAFSISRTTTDYTTWVIWGLATSKISNEIGKIVWSDDDGQTWDCKTLPEKRQNYHITLNAKLYITTLASFGTTAVIPCKINKDKTSTTVIDNLDNGDIKANCFALLYFFKTQAIFKLQIEKNIGDGTGLGGRHRMRTFSNGNWMNAQIGNTIRIYYGLGQDVYSAKSIDANGMLKWEKIASTKASGNHRDDIHADIWDIHLEPNSGELRLATDGGVFKKADKKWVTQNSGLHTLHVHNLAVMTDELKGRQVPNIAFVTHDNDAWYRTAVGLSSENDWTRLELFGDADCVDGDQALPSPALLWRMKYKMIYTDFGKGRPQGATPTTPGPLKRFVPFCNEEVTESDNQPPVLDPYIFPRTFSVIQTLDNELPKPLLDVVMLTKWPLYTWSNNHPVLSPKTSDFKPLSTTTGDSMVLLRNREFLSRPDSKSSHPDEFWSPFAGNMIIPAGTNSIWTSNGHNSTVLYFLERNPSGDKNIYKIEADNDMSLKRLVNIGSKVMDYDGGWGTIGFGPLYVNPYDPDYLMVLTEDGIRVSPPNQTVGVQTRFELDTVLTNLLTESGTYPIRYGQYYWGGPTSLSYKMPMATCTFLISGVAFRRDRPHQVLVGSPVAGLYVCLDEKREWLSLNEYLPQPYTQVAGVTLFRDNAYVALEGRGIWCITPYEDAKYASYFNVGKLVSGSRRISLYTSYRKPVKGGSVKVLFIIGGEEKEENYITDDNGYINLPANHFSNVLHISYSGNENIAACKATISPNQP